MAKILPQPEWLLMVVCILVLQVVIAMITRLIHCLSMTYTLYPFWTDLIRDNGSKILAKNFTDKTVFGWYDLREYNRR